MSHTPLYGAPGYGPPPYLGTDAIDTRSIMTDCDVTKAQRWARIGGLEIVVSPWLKPVPAVSLSPDFTAASDECIADMNSWLLRQFGTKEGLMLISNRTFVVSPKLYEQIKDLI